jgi:hypothetical protein
MYVNALEFLEEEREAWAPYERLGELSDEDLDRPMDEGGPTHGWTGRDLLGHMVGWQEHALAVARELAVDQQSATRERGSADWDQRGGDVVNAELIERWRALPLDEVRRRLREVPGELRGTLTVVPETRWLKDAEMLRFFEEETIEHYEEHRPELDAILAAAGR